MKPFKHSLKSRENVLFKNGIIPKVKCLVHDNGRSDGPCICKTIGIINFDERSYNDSHGTFYIPKGIWISEGSINITMKNSFIYGEGINDCIIKGD